MALTPMQLNVLNACSPLLRVELFPLTDCAKVHVDSFNSCPDTLHVGLQQLHTAAQIVLLPYLPHIIKGVAVCTFVMSVGPGSVFLFVKSTSLDAPVK